MEAVLFDGKTKTLKYEKNYPVPKIENDNEVIVKVAYSGVCGTDLHIIQGEFPAMTARPFPMGHEFSGTVYDMGEACKLKKGQKVVVDPNSACNLCDNCRQGNYHYCLTAGINSTTGIWKDGGWAQYCKVTHDRVFELPDKVTLEQALYHFCRTGGINNCVGVQNDGGWAQFCKVPDYQVFELPENVTLEQGGLCEPYSCVVHGFDRASPIPVGKNILIAGAGIIGNLWITALYHHGHRNITVSEMNKARLEIVKNLGANCRLVTPDVLEKEQKLYDVIIDCTGVGKVMEINFNYLSPGGKYVLFGCCPPTHKATVNPFEIYNKELTIIGVKINPFTFPSAIGWLSAMDERFLNYGRLGVKVFKLSEYQEALKDLKSGSISKAIFKVE